MTFFSCSSDETFALGSQLADRLPAGAVVALKGELGSGKTCLSQGIGLGLGVEEPLVSPTFPLLLEYQGRVPLVHMDLYRLGGVEDFILLDGETFLYDLQCVCLVEWSERIGDLLPTNTIQIRIDLFPDYRKITVTGL